MSIEGGPSFWLPYYIAYLAVCVFLLILLVFRRHGSISLGNVGQVLMREFDAIGIALFEQFRSQQQLLRPVRLDSCENNHPVVPEAFVFGKAIAHVDELQGKVRRTLKTALLLLCLALASPFVGGVAAAFISRPEGPKPPEYYDMVGLVFGGGLLICLILSIAFVVALILYVLRRVKLRKIARGVYADLREAHAELETKLESGEGDPDVVELKEVLEDNLMHYRKFAAPDDRFNS